MQDIVKAVEHHTTKLGLAPISIKPYPLTGECDVRILVQQVS